MVAACGHFVPVLLVGGLAAACTPTATVHAQEAESPGCTPDPYQYLDVMGHLSPEQLVDRDCDTVPDVEDACPDVMGVPQPLASRAGCPLELNEDGSY